MDSEVGALGRTLIYDADCGFCTRSAMWLSSADAFTAQSWQSVPDLHKLGLDEQQVSRAAFWVENGQAIDRAEGAIARALISRGGLLTLFGRTMLLPGVRHLAATVYRYIAKNRHRMPGGTNACKIPN